MEYPNFYHLPDDIRLEVESEGSIYLLGTRGTGKTTLLKSMAWDERATNDQLRKHLRDPFEKGLIGVYQKVPEARFGLLDAWTMTSSQQDRVTAAYLDCWSVELMAQAVRGLVDLQVFGFTATAERAVSEVGLKFFDVPDRARRVPSLLDVAEAAHSLGLRLEDDAEALRPPEVSLENRLSGYHIGHVSRQFAEALASAIRSENPGPAWRFRHCLDEAEGLSANQQRGLASLIRLGHYSITYAAAFTQGLNAPSDTGLPHLVLSEHDVRTVSLDWLEEDRIDYRRSLSRFRELAAGVLKVRLEAWDELQAASHPTGALTSESIARSMHARALPRWTIDQRLAHHIGTSDVAEDDPLLLSAGGKDVDTFMEEEFEGAPAELTPDYSARPRITYRDYLRSHGYNEAAETTVERRRQDNAEFRKRMVAAYLAICDEAGWDPIYCGWEEVLQLSDLCIRDFIWQMRELWREAEATSGLAFLTEPIPPPLQSRALKEASNRKIAFSRKYLTVSPDRTRRLVEGLSILTHELQARHEETSTLASPERGIFVVRRSTDSALDQEQFVLLSDAARQGYIKMVSASDTAWTFRVHRCIAPLAGFSYRRPQYSFPISTAALYELSSARDEEALRSVVDRIIHPQSNQLGLFEFSDA